MKNEEVLKLFPAPSFRKYQKDAIIKINEAFNSGVRLVLLEAPTGFGKSMVNTTFCLAYQPSFYVTPQLNLIDQMVNDPYLKGLLTPIKGRQNYRCVYDPYSTVDVLSLIHI